MLNGDDLAKKIFDTISGADPNEDGDIAGKYQRTIKAYLEENLEVQATFTGTNPATGATKTCPATGTVSYPTFIFLPAPDNITFHTNLSLAVSGGIITYSDPTNMLIATPAAFAPGMFTFLFPPSFDAQEGDVLKYMKEYCGNIVSQIKSNFVILPTAATMDVFVGTVTYNAIT